MNDKAKIAALRAALKDIRANSSDNHAVVTADNALTADDAEQALIAAAPAPTIAKCQQCGFMVALIKRL